MAVCSACGKGLVKQPVNYNGSPLSTAERAAYDTAQAILRRRLECRSCGEVCFFDRRKKTPPPDDGYGLCRQCGGADSCQGLSALACYKLHKTAQQPVLWSCPEHGVI